jgi:pilus assembly protein CpaE
MVVHALKSSGYEIEYARTGLDGLKTVPLYKPDIIITDVRLPDLSGYEVAQRLRRDPRFESIPIIFLTSQSDLSDKLKAFEVGADDYLSKPFQPEELAARVGLLVRRSELLRAARPTEELKEHAQVFTVHSLRGGVGCSSTAVNLAVMLYKLWERPTLLIDTVMNAGQTALMLNASPMHTWEDLADLRSVDVDSAVIETLISKHASGIDYIAAPSFPIATDSLSDDVWQSVMDELRESYEFIVVDTAHDFSNVSIHMLNFADHILMMLSPDMASIRSAVCALNIYEKLGYSTEKIVPVMTHLYPVSGIKQAQVEKVLKCRVQYSIPHDPAEFLRAINFGEPLVITNPDSPVASMFEDAAFALSKETLRNIPPAAPTPIWKRINNRITVKK